MTRSSVILLLAGAVAIGGVVIAAIGWYANKTPTLAPFIYPLMDGPVSTGPSSQRAAAPPAAPPVSAKPATASAAPPSQAAPVDSGQRLIIRTATLTLVVSDIGAAVGQARSLAESSGDGFVVSSVQREEAGRPAATVTIRVPAESFDLVMDQLHSLALQVTSEQITSKDVTEEFIDTDARLRNFKATEARYVDLLTQARTVDDILKVDQQLTAVRGQIEQLQGRVQFLQRSASTAAITVELRLPGAFRSSTEWSAIQVLQSAWSAFLGTLQVMLSALIWLGVFAPLWLVLFLIAIWFRRRHGARASAPPVR